MGRTTDPSRVIEVARVFLKIGALGFGGPAAHVALIEDEIVRRRHWVSRERLLDLIGLTNLIPGPNSTEVVLCLGHARAGPAGLVAAGLAFIAPAMASVLLLAWMYLRFGSRPELEGFLYGVKPVVIALVVRALRSLGESAVKGPITLAAGALAFALALSGMDPLVVLVAVGAGTIAVEAGLRRGLAAVALAAVPNAAAAVPSVVPFSLSLLFWTFLKIGSVVFGSGYVLLAYLHADLVVDLGWLTDRELLDAIAVGQLTPGPVFTTATFIGYLTGGVPGAFVATVGIFLPSFVFVAATLPLHARLRSSRIAGLFLDGVNVASLGLMAAVTVQLVAEALVDPWTIGIAGVAVAALNLTRLHSGWLIAGGAIAGFARIALRGPI